MKDSSVYDLQRSTDPGWFVITDTDSGIVLKFKQGFFNETQQITYLNDLTAKTALTIASDLRGIADYLQTFNPELLSCPRDWRKDVGSQIRNARKEKGVTVVRLQELSGIPHTHISRIEHGRANPTLDTLGRIADALEIEIKI